MKLRQLLDQRGKGCGDLRELRFLRRHVEPARIAFGELILENLQGLGVAVDQLPGRVHLSLQRAHLNRGDRDVGGERGVRRDHLKARLLLLRFERFHGPAIQAEHVGNVRDGHLGGEQVVEERVRVQGRRDLTRLPLPGGGEGSRDARIVNAALREHILSRHRQGRARRREVRIVLERSLDQLVERGRMEQRPPLRGNVGAFDEALGVPSHDSRDGGRGRDRRGSESGDIGRRRPPEIRARGAAGQHQENRPPDQAGWARLRAPTNRWVGKHRDAGMRGRSGLWVHAHGKAIVGQSTDNRQRRGPAPADGGVATARFAPRSASLLGWFPSPWPAR